MKAEEFPLTISLIRLHHWGRRSAPEVRAAGKLITCLILPTDLVEFLLISVDRTAYEIVDVSLADRKRLGVRCTFERHSPMTVGVDEGHCDFCGGLRGRCSGCTQ